ELSLDDIKGTGGKPQNADCIILVERTPDRKQVKLQGFSKDTDMNVRILLDVSPKDSPEPKFKYAGDLNELGGRSHEAAAIRRNKAWSRVPEGQWLSCGELQELFGAAERTTRRYLDEWVRQGWMDATPGAKKDRRYRRLSANSNGKENDS